MEKTDFLLQKNKAKKSSLALFCFYPYAWVESSFADSCLEAPNFQSASFKDKYPT